MTSIETSEQDDCVEHRMCGFRPEWQLHDTHQHVARIVPFQNQALTDLAVFGKQNGHPFESNRIRVMSKETSLEYTLDRWE